MRFGHKRRHGEFLSPQPAPVEEQEPENVTPPEEPEQPENPDENGEPEPDQTQEPEGEQQPEGENTIPPDASGHIWDAERYQTDAEGNPRYTVNGNFFLKPGQTHAE